MATTENTYTGDGSTTSYSLTFQYIDESDIKVSLDGVTTTAYSLSNATTVLFDTAPASDALIRIYRETDVDSLKTTFFAGSSIRAQDLNDNFLQNNYRTQELTNNTWDKETATIHSDETWVSNDTQIATTAAIDARFFEDEDETIKSDETWTSNDTLIATTQAIDNRVDSKIDTALTSDIATDGTGITVTDDGDGTITLGLGSGTIDLDRIKAEDIITQSEQNADFDLAGDDDSVFTSSAAIRRFENYVQNTAPSGTGIGTGRVWVDVDDDLTLSVWNGSAWVGITSGGTFTNQPKVVYVDASSGDDDNDGHRISRPKATIKAAINQINADTTHGDGSVVIVAAGVYQEAAPIQIQKNNVSIIGQALRSCIVHPTPATETATLFELNSGSYVANLTLTGMKASGTRGDTGSLWEDATHGLPPTQGWNFAFLSGATITKSPYIQNCTNFSDSEIDNSNLNTITPAGGLAGDTDSAVTGGGLLVDGSTVDSASPLRSMVCDSYTHVGLDGPGIFVTNNGYCQATSSYAFFNHFHIACINGGQANLAASTTDFGRFSLIADGQSPTNIFTSNVDGAASDGDITFNINQPVADASWHGSATRPQSNMLVTVNGVTYPVLSATAHTDSEGGSGWTVTISRPEAANKSNNLGLNGAVADDDTVQFFLRSMIASSGHTMEYVGSGTNYSALPENGGVPDDTAQVVELNDGKIWTATTDHNGKFTVGPLEIDQRTGAITIESGATVTNVVDDPSPQLGGDLDANTFDIILTGGSETEPSLTFTGDADTGVFSPAADTVAITTGGAEKLRVDSNGTVTIGTDSPRAVLPYGTGNFQSSAPITVETADADGAQLLLCANVSDTSGDNTAGLILARTRGSAIGDNTIVSDNDIVGTISFAAADGVDILNRTATIHSTVDGTPGANDTPGNLIFSTTADADNQPDERMRIDSSGHLLVGTTTNTPVGSSVGSVIHTRFSTINLAFSALRENNQPIIGLGRANGSGSEIVSDNNALGQIRWAGADGTDVQSVAAEITCFVDGTPGSDNMPGRLVFGTTASGASGATDRMTIDSSGNVGIGTTSAGRTLDVNGIIRSDGTSGALAFGGNSSTPSEGAAIHRPAADTLAFVTNSNERARIDDSGRLLVGTSSSRGVGGSAPADFQIEVTGSKRIASFVRNGGTPIISLGTTGSGGIGDTTLVSNGAALGRIEFAGADGTNLETPGATIEAEVDGTPGVNDMPGRLVFSTTADGAVSPTERVRIDSSGYLIGGNSSDISPAINNAQNVYAIGEGRARFSADLTSPLQVNRKGNDGTIVRISQDGTAEGTISVSGTTVSYNGAHLARWSQLPGGVERTEILRGTVLSNLDEMCEWGEEDNEQLNRMKVSDVEGDRNVSGVFQVWDDDDDTYINDFYCAMTGDFVIRIGAGVTVERGDLLMSAGDGTAKPQDDDIIRSKTIAKVTSTNVSCTYDDGSYCVPCVLMAC